MPTKTINRSFLPKNIEKVKYLFDKTKIDFDKTGISKSIIMRNKPPINSIIWKK